ncbi:MAG: hypothetical protein ACRC35_09770 [Angustibacter sp.]
MDQIDTLLDRFLNVASGERTALTRCRYSAALDLLRFPVSTENLQDDPEVRLLARITVLGPGLDRRNDLDPAVRQAALTLWLRLVTWIRRTCDTSDLSSHGVVREAQAALRQLERQRYRERHPEVVRRVWPDPQHQATF